MIAAVFVEFGDLIQQFPLGSRMLNLEMGIAAYEQVLQVYTRDAFSEDWAMTQNNLAIAFRNRIRGERSENLERAITAYEQSIQIYTCAAFPENWAATQNNLASAYLYRIRGERADNLERAIAAYEQALQVYTRAAFPENWAMTQNNLANAYSDRIRGERADNLELAIAAYKQALQVRTCTAFPENWAMTQNNLASAYSERIRGERADNLELAIAAYEQSLQVYTCDAFPENWAMTQNNLANAYLYRIRGERADNLERAIAAYEQSLQIYTRDAFPEDWAMTQNNLASAYLYRIRGERADNLERAIAAYKQALQVRTRAAFPEDWAATQNNLASAYSKSIRGERADNLELAIAAYEQALPVYTRDAFPEDWAMTQNNLANAYSDRIRGERADNLELAIAAYEQALQVRTCATFPKDCRQTAKNLGNLHWQEKSWAAARDAYQIAINAAEPLYKASISYAGKGDELKATADLPHRLAYAYAQLGNLQAAVLTLEQGRARGLSESLDRDRANLTQLKTLAPTLHTEYQDITQQLGKLESGDRDRMVSTDRDRVPDYLIQTTTKLRQKLDQTIAQIRQVPSYEDFLMPAQWEDIAIALSRDNPLVYLVTTPNGGMVTIVTVKAIEVLWLKDLTETKLIEEIDQTWFAAYGKSQSDRQGWYDAIHTTTRELWDILMGPLVQQIKELGFDRATLIPTGYLSHLPLHAAWTEDKSKLTGRRYALDDIHITYVPNAKSLTAAQSIAQHPSTDSILAIDEPKHRYLDTDTGEFKPVNPLPSSSREVASAIATFSTPTVLLHAEATRQAVLNALPNINVLHCSCHGNVNFQEPLRSGLAMTGDGEAAILTLRDFLDLKLTDGDRGGLRLAILSACETGMIGIENADEAISLPTGLLQAGVAAVIASLWSVSDLSTMLLLSKFYVLWRTENKEPSEALRQAQIWLRDSTETEIAPLLGKRPRNPNSRPFEHPYYWSAFSYTGI